MYYTVPVAVIERACNLSTKLPGLLFLQPAVRDDVVKHLASVDVLEQHIPVIIGADNVSHRTDVRMVEQCNNSRFPCSPYLL